MDTEDILKYMDPNYSPVKEAIHELRKYAAHEKFQNFEVQESEVEESDVEESGFEELNSEFDYESIQDKDERLLIESIDDRINQYKNSTDTVTDLIFWIRNDIERYEQEKNINQDNDTTDNNTHQLSAKGVAIIGIGLITLIYTIKKIF